MPQQAFFSGLIGSYGKHLLDQQAQEKDDARRSQETEIGILQSAARDPNLTDEGRAHIWGRLGEIASGKKPGSKGGKSDPMHDVFGQLTGMTTKSSPAPAAAPASAPALPAPVQAAPTPPAIDSSMAGAPETTVLPPMPQPAPAAASQAGTQVLAGQPQPPKLFYSSDEMQQRQLDAADKARQSGVTSDMKARDLQYNTAIDNWRKQNGGAEPDQDTKDEIYNFAHYGVKPNGKITIGKDVLMKDGAPVHPKFNANGDVVGYVPAEKKLNKYELDLQNKIANAKTAIPQKAGEDPGTYNNRLEMTVRRQQFDTDQQKLIGLGLGNQAKTAQIKRIQTQLASEGTASYRNANILWKGAWAAARERKRNDLDAFATPTNQLVDEELARVGTSLGEVSGILRGGMRGAGETPSKPSTGGSASTADALATKLGLKPAPAGK